MDRKLLGIIHGGEWRGGSFLWMKELLLHLDAFGWDVTAGVTDSPGSGVLDSLPDSFEIRNRSGTEFGRREALTRAIRRFRPSVIVPLLVGDVFPVVADLKSSGGPAPRLVFAAREISPTMLADVVAYREILDGVGCVSRFLEELVVEHCGVSADRVSHIPNGVAGPIRLKESEARSILRIGFSGRLDPDKSPLDLVPLVEGLEKRGLTFELDVAGVGMLENELRRQLLLAMRPNIRFLGWVPSAEMSELCYSQWDVVVLFSPLEGFPRSIIEAMAHGVVPVVADFCGRKEEGLLRDGFNSRVFPVGNVELAVESIADLAGDLELRNRMSSAAYAAATNLISTEDSMRLWANFLGDIADRPVARGSGPGQPVDSAGRLDRWLGSHAAEWVRGLRPPHSRENQSWPHVTFRHPEVEQRLRTEINRRCPGAV